MNDLKEITNILMNKYRINVEKYERTFIEKSIGKRMELLNFTKLVEYKYYLMSNASEAKILQKEFLIQFTVFFRDELIYANIQKVILPDIFYHKNKQETIRAWSAACSSGEEAYSLAMLIYDYCEKNHILNQIDIFGTDIDTKILELARNGAYNYDQLLNVKLKYFDRFFEQKYDTYYIKPEIKELVMFEQHDLLDKMLKNPTGSIYGDFDIIMCNNVLYYFEEKTQKVVIEKLILSLAPKGYLIIDSTIKNTIGQLLRSKLEQVTSTIYQRK